MYILYITGTSLYDAYHYKKPAMKRSPEYHFAFKLLQTYSKFLTTIRYNKSDWKTFHVPYYVIENQKWQILMKAHAVKTYQYVLMPIWVKKKTFKHRVLFTLAGIEFTRLSIINQRRCLQEEPTDKIGSLLSEGMVLLNRFVNSCCSWKDSNLEGNATMISNHLWEDRLKSNQFV